MLHRRPEAVGVQAGGGRLAPLPGDVALALLARAVAHGGLAVVVDLEHEPRGLLARVPEELLEHVDDVRHEVHRVVPHDHDPRLLGDRDVLDVGLLDLHRRGGHDDRHVAWSCTCSATRDSRPLTKRPESLVEYCCASSTASLITTPGERPSPHVSSYVPMRSSARSTAGIRSTAQCSE